MRGALVATFDRPHLIDKTSNSKKRLLMTNEFLIPYRKNSKWGYYSFSKKKIAIPCKFINASTFTYISELNDELAIVEDENLFGKFQFFINKKEEKRINLNHKYTWISEFFSHNGRYFSKVARKKFTGIKIGIINEFGNDTFKCEYDDCGLLTDGDGYCEKLLPVKKNNKWGIINDSKKIVAPFHFDFIGDFNEDGVAVCTICAFNHLNFIKRHNLRYFSIPCYGFIDKKGSIINQAHLYNRVRQFSECLAAVQKSTTKKSEEKGKWGFINSHFDEVIPFNYQDAKSFVNGLAAVREYQNYGDGKWGFIDKAGKLIIGHKFDNAYSFSKVSFDPDIHLAAIELNKKWGFIDKKGNLIIDCKFEEVYSFNNEIAAVYIDRKWGFINSKGELIIDCKYDWIFEKKIKSNPFITYAHTDKDFLVEGFLIKVSLNGKEGFIDTTGTEYWED